MKDLLVANEKCWPYMWKSPTIEIEDDIEAPYIILNPIEGCKPVSEGCFRCFAKKYNQVENLVFYEDLEIPYRINSPKRIYVCTHADLFQKWVSFSFIDALLEVIENTPQHRYYFLTRHVNRMEEYFKRYSEKKKIPSNVELGVSIELDKYCWRADVLRKIDHEYFYVAAEPLLGQLDTINLLNIRWLITAGEFGLNSRSSALMWFEDLRKKCIKTGTHFILKSLGNYLVSQGYKDKHLYNTYYGEVGNGYL